MYRFFIQSETVSSSELSIVGEDVNHIKNVLRMKAGEIIDCVDEQQDAYRCRIRELHEDEIICDILQRHVPDTELKSRITLYMGLPKSDKPELIIQKAVELGASCIVPVVTKRTVVKLDEKKAKKKVERWQAIAEAAAKQSKRAVIPTVGDVIFYKEALQKASSDDVVLIPYEKESDISRTREIIRGIHRGQSVSVLIGPEGGFEESEVEAAIAVGAKSITLGHRILRAETACMTILGILMYELDE